MRLKTIYVFLVNPNGNGSAQVIGPFPEPGKAVNWFEARKSHFSNWSVEIRTLNAVSPDDWVAPDYNFTPQ